MAGEAVDGYGVGVHPGVPRHLIGGEVVAREAGLVGAGAAGGLVDLVFLTARLDVRLAGTVARLADSVGDDALLRLAARMRVGGEDFRLIVAIAAGRDLGRRRRGLLNVGRVLNPSIVGSGGRVENPSHIGRGGAER